PLLPAAGERSSRRWPIEPNSRHGDRYGWWAVRRSRGEARLADARWALSGPPHRVQAWLGLGGSSRQVRSQRPRDDTTTTEPSGDRGAQWPAAPVEGDGGCVPLRVWPLLVPPDFAVLSMILYH
ncbi:unnamed protein product, partial [Urochloa humidicola]